MIKIENLKFKYPSSSQLILDIPKFQMKKGEKIFLYGPSGCGKTTFLEVLAGINSPLEGIVEISGCDVTKMSASEKDQFRADQMGYIFQSFNLIPYLNVQENITLPLYFSSKKRTRVSAANENKKTTEICKLLGIEPYLTQPVTELSVGQQQRVAAARAIIGQPSLILADEPTSALDFNHREKFIKLLFALCNQHQTSVLFVSHDRTLEKLFDRSLSLHEINISSKVDEDAL
ncbi:MAG: ABC transporter ATP-binding protein [Bdellovibrionales bacterium]|jgi:putative ABC transport system ATP-binding protein|nr:ABC transporter ATP-binding protein [Bdellovibrionales bacterium]